MRGKILKKLTGKLCAYVAKTKEPIDIFSESFFVKIIVKIFY